MVDGGDCILSVVPDIVRMRFVVDAVFEVLEDVVEHLLVLGVDSETRHGRRAVLRDGFLLHDERFGDGRDDTQSAPAAGGRTRHRVTRPQDRRELHSVTTHVTDRLRQTDRQTDTYWYQSSLPATSAAAAN